MFCGLAPCQDQLFCFDELTSKATEAASYSTDWLGRGKSTLPDSFEIQPRLRSQSSVAYTYGILGKHKKNKASEEEEKGTEEKYSWFCMCTEKCRQKARRGAGISVVKTDREDKNMSNAVRHLRVVHHIRSGKCKRGKNRMQSVKEYVRGPEGSRLLKNKL